MSNEFYIAFKLTVFYINRWDFLYKENKIDAEGIKIKMEILKPILESKYV